jgi:hypothetical protein
MLIEFKVANYRSIRAEQTLSMVASNYSDELPQNLISCDHVPGLKGTKLVKAVALYGANASGKSNIVAALRFFAEFVRDSATKLQPGAPTGAQPFKLDPACLTEPSKFEITAVINGIRTLYGIEMTRERVTSEYLVAYPKGRPQVWFERDWDEGKGKYVWSKSSEHFKHDTALHKKTRENAAFVSVAAQFEDRKARGIWDWFQNAFQFVHALESRRKAAESLGRDQLRTCLIEALSVADLGITDALREKSKADLDPKENAKVQKFREHFNRAMKELLGDANSFMKEMEREEALPTLRLVHRSKGGAIPMDFDFEESTGTRRFLALLCDSFQDLNHDRVMIVDELEESLHPLLVRNFVARFAEDREQAKTAISQLLFTTHNPLLLDQTLLRRDQIWFTEKDQEGATRLYPLTDFKPRKDESLVKGYLAGRYGGIPFIPEGMKF